uniref:Trafficking protein particle complex subunit 13 N-terminal domain-containing protein n=1 Tax=Trypanosoma congolense (strain IL3000) TaxID=1068625 RepID=G0UU17_TRYCI|nr:conserved hypothetical protein [Trypanosoma congolense IL3000]
MSKGVPPVPINEPRIEESGASVYSVTACVPAVLANPLSIKAAVLRKPELAQVTLPELVEEGDILFDVLANPLHHPLSTVRYAGDPLGSQRRSEAARLAVQGVGSALVLPSAVGKHFVGQPFRAILSFHNAASYPLTAVVFRINIVTPSVKHVALVNQEGRTINGKGNTSFTVEHILSSPGQYTLSAVVTYIDVTKESKRLTWATTIEVERGIAEIRRAVNVIPMMLRKDDSAQMQLQGANSGDQGGSAYVFLPQRRYALSICLQNVCTVPLVIEKLDLCVDDAFQVLFSSKNVAAVPTCGKVQDARQPMNNVFDDTWDMSEDLYMNPKDKRSFFFEFSMKKESLRLFFSGQKSSDNNFSAVSSKVVDLGYVVWTWRRPNGDSGKDRSNPIQLTVTNNPALELYVVNVEPEQVRVGQPITFTCVVFNHRAQGITHVALRIKPEVLAPAFMYAGPLLVPIGDIEPHGSTKVCLTLVPWQTGWVTLRGGIELCNAHEPKSLLWPLPPTKAQQGCLPLLSSAAGGSPTRARELEEPYPPTICEFLVS